MNSMLTVWKVEPEPEAKKAKKSKKGMCIRAFHLR